MLYTQESQIRARIAFKISIYTLILTKTTASTISTTARGEQVIESESDQTSKRGTETDKGG